MICTHTSDIESFAARVLPFLLAQEAANNLFIGILLRLQETQGVNPWGPEPPRLSSVEENGALLAAAWRTPPHNVGLTRATPSAVAVLAASLHADGDELPGVIGPVETADAFAHAWSHLTGTQASPMKEMRIYQLDRVTSPASPGYAAWATAEDAPLVITWVTAMTKETGTVGHNQEVRMREHITRRQVLLWRNPEPVSLAIAAGDTPHGRRISYVYTPPEQRCRGYATAVVAEMSRRQLAEGKRFCYLFTDLANPTTNHIYPLVGYQPVCDWRTYRFGE